MFVLFPLERMMKLLLSEVYLVRPRWIRLKGPLKGNKGKVTQVYRRRWCIYIEKLTKQKLNGNLFISSSNTHIGAPVHIPIHPSKCIITKLKIDKDRNDLLARKERALSTKGKGEKYTKKDVMGVD